MTLRALVVGGGIGGLAAASVLARRFDEVVLLEKDVLVPATLGRKGVGQGQHLHSLLMGAELVLGKLFPEIRAELRAAGAVELRAGLDQQVFEAGQWMPERDLGLTILAQTRGLLEREIRRRVAMIPTVHIRSATKVVDVAFDEGVEVAVVGPGGQSESLRGGLLVDASGRGGAVLRLVTSRVGAEVPEEEIASRIAYVSGLLDKPIEFRGRKENILIIPEPSRPAGGALLDVEGDKWIVSLHGRNGKTPPSDYAAWQAYARELPDPRIAERIAEATLRGPLSVYNKPVSTFRRFDKATRLPATYLPLGDVITSVNPIFGQGMAVALGHADALDQELGLSAVDLGPRYLTQAIAWSSRAWRRASAYDRVFLEDQAMQPRDARALAVLAAARRSKVVGDPSAHRALFLEGQMLPSWARP
jgi:2-polyprenyl-6-methoxyphenol hydroxylase-like FAD-dependent oxidoreductase